MEYYSVKEHYPWLYGIYDPGDVYIYLVLGDDAALVFDTGYGVAPLMPVIRKITDLPITCVLSHGHMDHANGAEQFDEAWISVADAELCARHTGKTARGKILKGMKEKGVKVPPDFDDMSYMASERPNLKILKKGHIYRLGKREAQILQMEGHTRGSVGLLIKEERILLTGDGANPFMWLFLEESTSIEEYIAMLRRNMTLDFDIFFTAHDHKPFPKQYFEKFISVAENANTAEAKPFDRMPERKGMVYKEGDVSIVFSEAKI